jgi:hypothetical protein
MMRLAYLLSVLLLSSGCAAAPHATAISLPPSALNAAPDEFDGKTVLVRGWMQSEFENYAIWDSKSAKETGDSAISCVSLRIPSAMLSDAFHNRYVAVEGLFLKRLPPRVVALGTCNYTVLQLNLDHPPKVVSQPGG